VAKPLEIYEFERVDDLLRGWQVHVERQRITHLESARTLSNLRYWLGVPAATLTALAGSSTVAAWQSGRSNGVLALISAAVALGATALVSMSSFMDFGVRAERHRSAANEYKGVLRTLERLPPVATPLEDLSRTDPRLDAVIGDLQSDLQVVDRKAPEPPRRIARKVARREPELLSNVHFIQHPKRDST